MSFEPRMRGRRFLRPASKKSKRVKDQHPSFVYSKDETNPVDITGNILNAIDHLGNQRFVLPPFAEHFHRWLMDVQSLLNEFKTEVPEAADTIFQNEMQGLLTSLQYTFSKRVAIEISKSNQQIKLQQELTQLEAELSKLERSYKSQLHELRRHSDKSNQKLRGEINSLDKKRLQILRKKPSIFQRIMRRSKSDLEDANSELENKKSKLQDEQLTIERILQNNRSEYTTNRQKLISDIDLLKHKVENHRENIEDDALDTRKRACQQIHSAMDQAMLRITSKNLKKGLP